MGSETRSQTGKGLSLVGKVWKLKFFILCHINSLVLINILQLYKTFIHVRESWAKGIQELIPIFATVLYVQNFFTNVFFPFVSFKKSPVSSDFSLQFQHTHLYQQFSKSASRLAASASTGDSLKVQFSEALGWGLAICVFTSPPDDSDAC